MAGGDDAEDGGAEERGVEDGGGADAEGDGAVPEPSANHPPTVSASRSPKPAATIVPTAGLRAGARGAGG